MEDDDDDLVAQGDGSCVTDVGGGGLFWCWLNLVFI